MGFAAENGRPAVLVIDGAEFLTRDSVFVETLVRRAMASREIPVEKYGCTCLSAS